MSGARQNGVLIPSDAANINDVGHLIARARDKRTSGADAGNFGEKPSDLAGRTAGANFVSFAVYGAPRTKKNHTRILRVRGRTVVAQAESHDVWANGAILQLRAKSHGLPAWVRGPVNLSARIYRERDTGDLGNYLAAVCDALQASGVIENDREIRGFDGSRLMKDAKNPRVEISLSPLNE